MEWKDKRWKIEGGVDRVLKGMCKGRRKSGQDQHWHTLWRVVEWWRKYGWNSMRFRCMRWWNNFGGRWSIRFWNLFRKMLGRRWSGSLCKLECQLLFVFNIQVLQKRLGNPYSFWFFIRFFGMHFFNNRFKNPYFLWLSSLNSGPLRSLLCIFLLDIHMLIRGDIVNFWRWIHALVLELIIQIASKGLGTCGWMRPIWPV